MREWISQFGFGEIGKIPQARAQIEERLRARMNNACKLVAFLVMAEVLALSPVARAGGTGAESEKVVKQFLVHWDARNLYGMMTSYADDSVVLMPQQKPFKGKQQIHNLMKGFVDDFSKPSAVWNTNSLTAEGQIVYILWKGETAANKFPFGSNTFVVEDGKITYQTIAISPVAK